jgi:hypothetical protein
MFALEAESYQIAGKVTGKDVSRLTGPPSMVRRGGSPVTRMRKVSSAALSSEATTYIDHGREETESPEENHLALTTHHHRFH